MKISCILLAAGSSTRMGSKNKLVLEVDGDSLVRKTLKEIQKVSFEEVIVVLGHEHERVNEIVRPLSPRTVVNEKFATGMHSSIKAGVKSLQNFCDAFFICLADQPYFDHKILEQMIQDFGKNKILVPTFDGTRGHPVLISSTFIPEILEEPDGDYGCAYLLKRYPEKVEQIPVTSQGVLIDIDSPKDYERIINKSYDAKDPTEEFYAKVTDLRKNNHSFTIATVIEVIGSASARVGSKAIFDYTGKNILGWVGGGCAERFIGEESVSTIKDNKPRTVLADLDDEIFGLGVACGGKMKVFIDPVVPSETIELPETEKFQNVIRSLSGFYGWNVKKNSEDAPETIEELLLLLSRKVASIRGRTHDHLRSVKEVRGKFHETPVNSCSVIIIGRTRITEALARHFSLLNFNITAIGPNLKNEDYPSSVKCHCLDDSYDSVQFHKNDIVIVASHTSQDPEFVRRALEAKCAYVGMIGSYKRTEEVLNYLGLMDMEINSPLYIPAGMDIDARNPDEIALSIVVEILTLRARNI